MDRLLTSLVLCLLFVFCAAAQPSATSCKLPTGAVMFVERYLNTSTYGKQLCNGSGPAFQCSLSGWLYVPRGSGPFTGVVLNHSSENTAEADYCSAVEYFVGKNYVVFIPVRRGYKIASPLGPNSGELAATTLDLLTKGEPSKWPGAARALNACGVPQNKPASDVLQNKIRWNAKQIDCVHTALLRDHVLEVRVALNWLLTLKPNSKFLVNRAVLLGHAEGANITALAASDPHVYAEAAVLLSPAERRWDSDNQALRDGIKTSITQRRFPVAVMQPVNAFSTGPTAELTDVSVKLEQPKGFMSLLLPEIGGTEAERHLLFGTRASIVKMWTPLAEQFFCLYTATGGKKC
jgi:pimeloyl-ACP methyl ester carboxylesterase